MMRIGLLAAAYETRLLGNIAKVLPVAIAAWCSDGKNALVNPRLAGRRFLMGASDIDMISWSRLVGGFRGFGR